MGRHIHEPQRLHAHGRPETAGPIHNTKSRTTNLRTISLNGDQAIDRLIHNLDQFSREKLMIPPSGDEVFEIEFFSYPMRPRDAQSTGRHIHEPH